jgi:hypothetical protein
MGTYHVLYAVKTKFPSSFYHYTHSETLLECGEMGTHHVLYAVKNFHHVFVSLYT